jgi:hypothetical protein
MDFTGKQISQQELKDFVECHVIVCQSALVEKLLEKEIVDWHEVSNLYRPFEPYQNQSKDWICDDCGEYVENIDIDTQLCKNCFEANQEPQEIFEWWLVTGWLLAKLEAHGEPVLYTDYGKWWGRTTTGQAVYIDHVIEEIYSETC